MIRIRLKPRYKVDTDAMYTQKELESIFDVSEPTVTRLVRTGNLPFKLVGSRRRFNGQDILNFIKGFPNHK